MSRERRESLTDESGVALVAALLAVVILTGLAVVFVATAVSTSRSTAISRDFETAIHVAEAGADEVVARVNWEKDHVTSDSQGADHALPTGLNDEEQREWAVEQVLGDDGLEPLVTGTSGEGFGIRPRDATTGDELDLIFGVSLVPDRARPERVRVIRMRFQREFFQPKHGIQGCGDMTVRGSASVTGDLGTVHANGNVQTHGDSYHVQEGITASGTVDPPSAGQGGASEEDCPEVHAEDLHARAGPPFTCYEAGDPDCPQLFDGGGTAVLWWDLCPDGTARRAAPVPCDGEIAYVEPAQGGPANNHKGWRHRTGGGQDPRWQTRDIQSGVFYIHETNARIEGSGSATATVIVEKDDVDNGRSGNLHFSGSSAIVPALEGIAVVTDRDLEMVGDASGGGIQAGGMIAVGEQADLAGTAAFQGPVYIRDDPHTTYSPVSTSEVRGNFSVTYDEELDITLLGSIRITAWNELR